MTPPPGELRFRVRYCDTDQMKTYYNARVLEWFEYGRTELLRSLGKPYREWERDGVFLPVTETHITFEGRAEYDDELVLRTTMSMVSRVRLRCDCRIDRADTGQRVCTGYTIHVLTDISGKPIRPPRWAIEIIDGYLAQRDQGR